MTTMGQYWQAWAKTFVLLRSTEPTTHLSASIVEFLPLL